MFNILRKGQTVSQSDCNAFHFQEQHCLRVAVPPPPRQRSVLSVTLAGAVLLCVKWHLLAPLARVSLVANDLEQLLRHRLIICIFSLEKRLFSSFAHFKLVYLTFIIEW